MKFNVTLKVLTAFFITSVLFVISFFSYLNSVKNEIITNAGQTISHGVLENLETKLKHQPQSAWENTVKHNNYDDIYVISIDKLKLNAIQLDKLNKNETIFTSGQTFQFLNLVIVQHTAYRRIGNSTYALAYYFSDPAKFISHYMSPALKQITEHLEVTPADAWQNEILKLEKMYGFPLHIYKKESAELPEGVFDALLEKNLVYKTTNSTTQISIIYYAFQNVVLKIGPLTYLPATTRISDILYYFVWSFLIFVFFIITLFSLLFIRNMKKIYNMTQKYSEGDFSYHNKIGVSSVLYELHQNISNMGRQIRELIESHKQMCRFVAHEIRTPLSTIQMTTDSIKRKSTGDIALLNKMDSIQDDITEMDEIVSSFLIYSKVHANEFTLQCTNTAIIPYLRKIIEPYDTSSFKIKYETNDISNIAALIDRNVFKHAITNLMTNAMKFASRDIHISLSLHDNFIFIHIDDDGPGLPEDPDVDIFREYSTATQTTHSTKHIGLGLAIARKIVTLHHGKLTATDSPTLKGARFTIMLPCPALLSHSEGVDLKNY